MQFAYISVSEFENYVKRNCGRFVFFKLWGDYYADTYPQETINTILNNLLTYPGSSVVLFGTVKY